MTREQIVSARHGRLEAWPARENTRAHAPPRKETKLVTEESPCGRDDDHPLQGQIAPARRQPRKHDQRLAFQDAADEHRGIAVLLNQRRKVHRSARSRSDRQQRLRTSIPSPGTFPLNMTRVDLLISL